jgi:hypothetical protein
MAWPAGLEKALLQRNDAESLTGRVRNFDERLVLTELELKASRIGGENSGIHLRREGVVGKDKFGGEAEGRKPAQPSIPEGILGFPSL